MDVDHFVVAGDFGDEAQEDEELSNAIEEQMGEPEEVIDEAMAIELGYGGDVTALNNDIEAMHEENPMLGLRGCRLAIVRPEVTTMQAEAIINAAADVMEADPKNGRPFPRIMVPLVGSVAEFACQALAIKQSAEKIKAKRKIYRGLFDSCASQKRCSDSAQNMMQQNRLHTFRTPQR